MQRIKFIKTLLITFESENTIYTKMYGFICWIQSRRQRKCHFHFNWMSKAFLNVILHFQLMTCSVFIIIFFLIETANGFLQQNIWCLFCYSEYYAWSCMTICVLCGNSRLIPCLGMPDLYIVPCCSQSGIWLLKRMSIKHCSLSFLTWICLFYGLLEFATPRQSTIQSRPELFWCWMNDWAVKWSLDMVNIYFAASCHLFGALALSRPQAV